MLKALEIVGFKSFADKTRFEFPPGITVIVGPNGSGKSNVVDAMKWVLGEQSVKSLRGREMADVIFNGSDGRRGLNSAEITITLDNSKRLLAVDSPEVHITRRVYRSGEGEYLINRQPCRLRDIRDLLAGTGLGTHAYSVIEQGKVDVLLQASAQDRRLIFEEAAGIGRFKAKKLEALRRLERVEQNLLRLSDIVDEVESRLRSVKAQAGKARRYKEYADRLQELRTQVALVDWRQLSQRLAEDQAELTSIADERDGLIAQAEASEARLLEAETQIGLLNEEIRQAEQQSAADRERIAGNESAIEQQRARQCELEQDIGRRRKQLADLSARAGDLEQQVEESARALSEAEEHHRRVGRALAEGERGLTELIARLDQLRAEHQQRRADSVEQMRLVAALASRIGALETQAAAADAARRRHCQALDEARTQWDAVESGLAGLRQQQEQLTQQAHDCRDRLQQAQQHLDERLAQRAAVQAEIAELQQRRSGLVERIAVLEELEKRCEGLSAGVKEVLRQAREAEEGPFQAVRGLVADLIQVGVELAPLVEIVLGERAQHVVVSPDADLVRHLQEHPYHFSGRVGFLFLDGDRPADSGVADVDLAGQPGVLGRADRLVQCERQYAPLIVRLLGNAWIVENLQQAFDLRAPGDSLSFVTLAGEHLAADGALSVGPRQSSVGLISRRSELRALRMQLVQLDEELADRQQAEARIVLQIAGQRQRVETLSEEHQQILDALGGQSQKIAAAEERRSQLDRQRKAAQAELEAADAECGATIEALGEVQNRHREGETILADMETQLAALSEQIDRRELERQSHHRDTTETKVELAKCEERIRNLRARARQFEETRQERLRTIQESRQRLAESHRLGEELQRSVLKAESEIAALYLRKEAGASRTLALIHRREDLQRERSSLNGEAQRSRGKIRRLEERIHAKEISANEVQHDRNNLAQRLREDYGIELAEVEHQPSDEEQRQRDEVQQEIEELRRKLNHLGSVNLEALEELEQLESRYNHLGAQFKDLSAAKNSLAKIIDKINADSRRLFTDTLQAVKGHFGQLFRDLFGGGRADIVLDEGVDILESGIEIVARPPGKEPRSISLLSGGEKTLTAAALLLAIFRSRPSPFCVLDEVDAALDEANIDRFIKVIQDFLAWTQFIIVTHSKKTMTCANSVYGVTMQQSGVSKQVSVRFEDVSDNGEIHLPPDRLAPPPASEDETQAA